MDDFLILSAPQIDAMRAHVEKCLPEEGCGLLGGRGKVVELVVPVTNRLHSAVRYDMEPKELLQALMDFDARGLEMLASFHSHPGGPAEPSETDIREFTYFGTYTLIWVIKNTGWSCSGFAIHDGIFRKIEICSH